MTFLYEVTYKQGHRQERMEIVCAGNISEAVRNFERVIDDAGTILNVRCVEERAGD